MTDVLTILFSSPLPVALVILGTICIVVAILGTIPPVQIGPKRSIALGSFGAVLIVVAIFTAWLLVPPGSPPSPPNGGSNLSTLERIRDAGVVRVGLANEHPYAFVNSDGTLSGESIEVARRIFRRLGVSDIEGVVTEFESLIPSLQAKRFDVITAGMWIQPERCDQVLFADPQYRSIVEDRPNPMYGATAFRKEDTDLRDAFNTELQKLKNSGELEEILSRFDGYVGQTSLPGTMTAEDLCNSSQAGGNPSVSTVLYDNFNNSAFDGKWNTSLWARAKTDNSDVQAIQQRNGMLVVSTEDSFAALNSFPNKSWLMSELDYIEADLKLGGDSKGEYGHVQLALVSEDTISDFNGSPQNWFVVCQIETCDNCGEAEQPVLTCFTPNGYDPPGGVKVNYDTWHTIRIKVDPETTTFNFYFDGQFYDASSPPNANDLKDDAFTVSVGAFSTSDSIATGYIDEVRVVTKK